MGKLVDLAISSLPTFKCLVPSLGKTVTLRSFVVKEQKLLLIAKQAEGDGKSLDTIVGAVTQLLQNCVVNNDIKVTELPSFDIEYMFLQLMMHSTGTKRTKAHYRCLAPVLDEAGNPVMEGEGEDAKVAVCGQPNPVIIDLSTAKVSTASIRSGIIDLKTDTIDKLVLTYPTFAQITNHDLAVVEDDVTGTFRIYGECMKYVYKADGTQLVLGEDYTPEDAVEMLEMLPQEIFEKIVDFFATTPSITGEVDFKCRKCGHESKLGLRGLEDFF